MAKVKVKRLFEDVVAGVDRNPGDEFECDDARAEEILSKLGESFVEVVAEEKATAKTTTRKRTTKKAE